MNTPVTDTPSETPVKTRLQGAEDVAYTINHAIACTATDFGAPLISHGVAKRIFHTHSNLLGWFVGEGVGDLAAVPVTIALERVAPKFTKSLRGAMEASLGWAFRKSSQREAKSWAKQNLLTADSPEAKAKAKEIYDYEIDHLPQAAVWTATSMVLNIVTQKLFHTQLHKGHDHSHGHDHGHDHGSESLLSMVGALFVGKAVSTGLVVGTRAVFPDKARQWDSFAARTFFEPLSDMTSKLFGGKKEADSDDWAKRTGNGMTPAASPAR